MKVETARRLLMVDIQGLDLVKLQRHIVKLLDAKRESQAEYGIHQAVMDGYYVRFITESAFGYKPRYPWLTENLGHVIDEAVKRENELFNEKESDV